MLRIGFDLDGVFADMESELVRQARFLFGDAVARERTDNSRTAPRPAASEPETPSEPSDARQRAAERSAAAVPPLVRLELTPQQQRKLWRHVESIENFWQSLAEIEAGSVARAAALAAARRWEVLFLTRRPETAGATAQVQSQLWLESKGFPLPSVFVVQRSRGRIAQALGLDIIVDDRHENCLDVVGESDARAVLVWRDDEQQMPTMVRRLGIATVKSVREALDLLRQIDAPDKRGMLDRMRRVLGRNEPAAS